MPAAHPRWAVCDASLYSPGGRSAHFACDDALTRCVAEGTVYLLASTAGRSRLLTTIIDYGDDGVPAEPSDAVREAIADRDAICALLDAVRTDPTPYVGGSFVELMTSIDDVRTSAVLCGAEARSHAVTASRHYSTPSASCGRFMCFDRTESGNFATSLYAERDPSGALHILASWSGIEGSVAPFADVHDALRRHPCP